MKTHTQRLIGRTLALACTAAALSLTPGVAMADLSNGDCTKNRVRDTGGANPYRNSRFDDVMKNTARMQFPTASFTCLKSESGSSISFRNQRLSSRFLVASNRFRFFFNEFGSRSKRMELRGNNFASRTSGSSFKTWEAKFRLPNRDSQGYSRRFTIGQLFADGQNDMARIAYRAASLSGKTKSLWLEYEERPGANIQRVHLGSAPSGSGSVTIRMTYRRQDGRLTVYRNGNSIRTVNVAGWTGSGKNVYFKAGCYLQEGGNCRVEFESLRFSD